MLCAPTSSAIHVLHYASGRVDGPTCLARQPIAPSCDRRPMGPASETLEDDDVTTVAPPQSGNDGCGCSLEEAQRDGSRPRLRHPMTTMDRSLPTYTETAASVLGLEPDPPFLYW